jgi:hypothetical protein
VRLADQFPIEGGKGFLLVFVHVPKSAARLTNCGHITTVAIVAAGLGDCGARTTPRTEALSGCTGAIWASEESQASPQCRIERGQGFRGPRPQASNRLLGDESPL